jgi:carbonic anhydrase
MPEKNSVDLLTAAGSFAILTCPVSDSSKLHYKKMELGEALIVRKANGRASDDAIESLILSYMLLGTKKWVIIHDIGDDESPVFDGAAETNLLQHSRFEMAGDGEVLRNSRLDDRTDENWQAAWIIFWEAASRNLANETQTIRDDIDRIRNHPRTPADVKLEGYIRDMKLGTIIQI